MNKWCLAILSLALLTSEAALAHEIHLFLPGYQKRYENDEDQSIRDRQYNNYNLAGIISDKYAVGLEMDERKDDTSAGALRLVTKFQEVNLYAGYLIYSKILHEEYNIVFDLVPLAYFGQNRMTVETHVGALSAQSVSEDNYNYALGLQTNLRLSYFIIQPEVRYAYSRSYAPSYVLMYGIRAGFRIGL